MATTKPNPQFPKGQLAKMTPQKLHLLIGEITSLMLVSKVHRHYQVRDISDIILPAINLGQYRIYRNQKREPIAFVTWAFLSPDVEKKYLSGKMVLSEKERTSGNDQLYYGNYETYQGASVTFNTGAGSDYVAANDNQNAAAIAALAA